MQARLYEHAATAPLVMLAYLGPFPFLQIASYLVAPLLIFGSLVVAFSQMFYTLLQVNCENSIVTPVCTVRDAYRVVYMLIRGESLVDGFHQLSVRAIVLVAFLLLCLVLFMLSLFVMLIVASFKLDFESIALRSWWEKKLAYHYTAADLGLPGCILWNDGRGLSSIGVSERLERAWDLLVVSLIGGPSMKREHWYVGAPTSNVLSWPLWILAIIAIPVWIALGAVTLGLLWPPQLRRCLFRPIGFNPDRKTKTSIEEASASVAEMREEIRQLKLLSFDKSGDVERELRELKDLLHSALKES
jgi:hypothetical protein